MKPEQKEILVEAVNSLGSCDVVVSGMSMWPFIRRDDKITLSGNFQKPFLGAVIAFFIEEKLTVHRVIWYKKQTDNMWKIRVKGDSSPFSCSTISSSEVLGVVCRISRGSGRIWLRFPFRILAVIFSMTIQIYHFIIEFITRNTHFSRPGKKISR